MPGNTIQIRHPTPARKEAVHRRLDRAVGEFKLLLWDAWASAAINQNEVKAEAVMADMARVRQAIDVLRRARL